MKFSYYILALLFFTACNSGEKPSETSNDNTPTEEIAIVEDTIINVVEPIIYQSDIRKGEAIIVGEIYIDTLTFLFYNDDADYFYNIFLTRQKDTVYIVCNDIIDNSNEGRLMTVTWKIDSLYEAGEGDELYYQERMIKYETNWELETSFEAYLKDFTTDFVNLDAPMNGYINSEVGFYSSVNRGIYCILDKPDSVKKYESFKNYGPKIVNETPYGDFCEGYKGVKNGFYFNRILSKNLPKFERLNDDLEMVEEEYQIPSKFESNELMIVTIINEEYFAANLYFIQIDNKWYFFAQDLCDCSA